MNENQTQLDPQVVNLAKSIRQVETGGAQDPFTARGKSGEFGAYQYTTPTWQKLAKQHLGQDVPLEQSTKEQQNEVAYKELKTLKDQGYKPDQIASIWNSGKPDWQGNVGTNSHGVKFDTPDYVDKVTKTYQSFKNGQVPQQQTTTSTVQPQAPQLSDADQKSADTYKPISASVAGEGPLQAGVKAVQNLPSSFLNLGKGLYNVVRHPINTAKGLYDVGAGAAQEGLNTIGVTDNNNDQTQKFDAFKGALADRYGSLENLQRTATNDPAGFGADVLALLEGGAKIADIAAGTTKTGLQAAEAAQNFKNFPKTGLNVMPALPEAGAAEGALNTGLQNVASAATYVPRKVAGAAGTLASEALGKVTGVGAETIKEGYGAASQGGDAYKAYVEGLKGKASPEELVGSARDALGQIVEQRRTAYQDDLAKMAGETTNYNVKPIFDELQTQLKGFKVTTAADGSLDFSRSPIRFNKAAQADIQNIVDTLSDYGLREGDRTAVGIDSLKRAFGDLYTPSGQGRGFVEAMRQKARGILSEVPGYDNMASKYEAASGLIEDIQKNLSLGDKAAVETTFKKLTSALRNNNEFRQQFLKELDEVGGKNILPKIAGQQLSPLTSRGLTGIAETAGAAGSFLVGGATGLMPVLGLIAGTSPRLVGELLRAAGLGEQAITKVMGLVNPVAKTGLYAAEVDRRTNPSLREGQ